MVRKASTLNDVEVLCLSETTKKVICRLNFRPGDIVDHGRMLAAYPNLLEKAKSWEKELVSALDEAGFIRHDIDAMTDRVMVLYDVIDGGVPTSIFSEEIYEKISPVTQSQLDSIQYVLNGVLNAKEKEIITDFYGIGTDRRKSWAEIAFNMATTRDDVRVTMNTAISKLRECTTECLSDGYTPLPQLVVAS